MEKESLIAEYEVDPDCSENIPCCEEDPEYYDMGEISYQETVRPLKEAEDNRLIIDAVNLLRSSFLGDVKELLNLDEREISVVRGALADFIAEKKRCCYNNED